MRPAAVGTSPRGGERVMSLQSRLGHCFAVSLLATALLCLIGPRLAQAGVKSTFIRLADVGIHGNGHMMMLEKNSDAIAKVMADWLDRTLPGGAKKARSANAQSATHAAR